MAGGHVLQGACMTEGVHGRGACVAGRCAWQGGMHGRGACMVGGVHGLGTCVVGGICGRGHAW